MTWANFHFTFALAVVFFAHGGLRTHTRRQHVIGAHLLFWSWVASWAARNLTDGIAPIAFYVPIDLFVLCGLGYLMVSRRALWACACVVFHFFMMVCHLRFSLGSLSQFDYLTQIGVLFFLSLVALVTAIAIGRFSWGETVDRFLPRPWGYTWSGLVTPRNSDRPRNSAQ